MLGTYLRSTYPKIRILIPALISNKVSGLLLRTTGELGGGERRGGGAGGASRAPGAPFIPAPFAGSRPLPSKNGGKDKRLLNGNRAPNGFVSFFHPVTFLHRPRLY